jgi:SAM-dependent methyltransferase
MTKINLMKNYPSARRNLEERASQKTEGDRIIARKFDKEFFDGDRKHGYGGYNYHPRFWTGVVEDMIRYYHLKKSSKILDVGCGKGFTLYDFTRILPGVEIKGIDISQYAIENGKEEVKPFLSVGTASDLSKFKNKEFDLAISLITLHNLELEECKQALREIERVGKKAFITVDAWRDETEKERMINWNLTARTLMSAEDWENLFEEVSYTGDYYWNIV